MWQVSDEYYSILDDIKGDMTKNLIERCQKIAEETKSQAKNLLS